MKVVVAGASGAIGLPLVRELIAAGHDVTALHRSESGRQLLLAAGATPVRVDVFDRPGLLAALDGHPHDAVISELTAMKKPPAMHSGLAETNRLRIEGTANLLAAAEQVGAQRFITQSMVFGYGYEDFGGRVLTEADTFAPPGRGRFEEHLAAMRSNESQVLGATRLDGIALRYGFFYGPGAAGDVLVEGLRKRRVPVIRHGGVLPWVHVDDAARATVATLEKGEAGTAYNIADTEPVSFAQLVTTVADAVDARKPMVVPSWLLAATPYLKVMMTGGLRVSSAKAHNELGWTPRFPSYREGIAAMALHYRPKGAA